MRIFTPRPLRNYYKKINSSGHRTRESMIKSLNKRGFTEVLLNSKSNKELHQMMNRFASYKSNPSRNRMGLN